MRKTIPTDALVTAGDVLRIKTQISRGDFKRLVYELVSREPELVIAISERFDLVTTMLERAALSDKQRADLMPQLSLLTWTHVLLLDRAHRRHWDDFLPSEEVMEASEPGEDAPQGGAE